MPRTTQIDRTLLRDALLVTLAGDGPASRALAQEVGESDRIVDVRHVGTNRMRVKTASGGDFTVQVSPTTDGGW